MLMGLLLGLCLHWQGLLVAHVCHLGCSLGMAGELGEL